MKTLIVYYSYSHGNTKKIAEALAKATEGDIERIETVRKYGPYEETIEVGQAEVQRGECPPLRPMKKDIAGYDVIALGSPTWWYTMAPAMRTFVTTHDFTGKKMISSRHMVAGQGAPSSILRISPMRMKYSGR